MDIPITSSEIKCPQCQKPFTADVWEWESESGLPTYEGYGFYCENLCDLNYDQTIQISDQIHQWMKDTSINVNEYEL